ncbi:MAG: hypothetical protein KME29_31680 [Calothrix sp. FI2-JRJ7]|nr:hypothetical protein [Calothrix sp. FI2-JRJ7]
MEERRLHVQTGLIQEEVKKPDFNLYLRSPKLFPYMSAALNNPKIQQLLHQLKNKALVFGIFLR